MMPFEEIRKEELFIVLIEDDEDHDKFWACLWRRDRTEFWRSDVAYYPTTAQAFAQGRRNEYFNKEPKG